jgi:hypothetical protein
MMKFTAIYTLLIIHLVSGPKTDPLRASVTKQEQWAFIKCHVLLDTPAAEVYNMLHNIARSQALSRPRVFQLYKEFNDWLPYNLIENMKFNSSLQSMDCENLLIFKY